MSAGSPKEAVLSEEGTFPKQLPGGPRAPGGWAAGQGACARALCAQQVPEAGALGQQENRGSGVWKAPEPDSSDQVQL